MAVPKLSQVFIVVLFLIVFLNIKGVNRQDPAILPSLTTNAYAGVGVIESDTNYLLTSSQDGRKIYLWQCQGAFPPKFVGQAEAILKE